MCREDWCFRDIYKFEQGYLSEGVLEKQTTAIYYMTQRASIVLARFGHMPLCKRGQTMALTKKHLFCTKNMNLPYV